MAFRQNAGLCLFTTQKLCPHFTLSTLTNVANVSKYCNMLMYVYRVIRTHLHSVQGQSVCHAFCFCHGAWGLGPRGFEFMSFGMIHICILFPLEYFLVFLFEKSVKLLMTLGLYFSPVLSCSLHQSHFLVFQCYLVSGQSLVSCFLFYFSDCSLCLLFSFTFPNSLFHLSSAVSLPY